MHDRHLDITTEDEAATLCGGFPEPGPDEATLTTDPSAVTCRACAGAYAIARIEHLVFGRTPTHEGLRAIVAAQDANRPVAP